MKNPNATLDPLVKKVIRDLPPYQGGSSIESVQQKYPHLTEIDKLDNNENQFGVSPMAVEAMKAEAAAVNRYPDARAGALRRSLAEFFAVGEECVMVTSGATGSLELMSEIFVLPGDEVIYCQPTYMAYGRYVSRREGIPVELPLTADLEIDLDAMLRAVTDKTKMMMVCNPNNPTGTVLAPDRLRAFLKQVPSNIIVLIDEAYIEFADIGEEASVYREIENYDNLAVLRTFSKLYGFAGERVGYTLGSEAVIANMNKASTFFTATRVGQAGALAALADQEFARRTVAETKAGRAYLTRELSQLGWKVYPSHTNFIYADSGLDTSQLALELQKYGIIIRGNFQYSRISIGRAEQNERLVTALREINANGLATPHSA